jgi:hypothetical protein
VRIVIWNCGMALARKAPSLMALNPDIAVVQECSKNSVDVLYSNGFSAFGSAPIRTRDWLFFAVKSWPKVPEQRPILYLL